MKPITKISTVSLLLAMVVTVSSCGDEFLSPEVTEYATADQINDMVESGGGDGVVNLMNATMLGAYNVMIAYQDQHDVFGIMALGLAGDLMTEDMVLPYPTHFIYDYQMDNRAAANRRPRETWNFLYSMVAKCNEVIAAVSPEVTNPKLKAVLGEALALRAFAFVTLAQRYQQTYIGNENTPGIPLNLTANDDRPSVVGRGTLQGVYDKVLTDYDSAVSYLKGAAPRANKTTIDYQVAAGLFARALMVVGDWDRAAKYANIARDGYVLMSAEEIAVDGFNSINNAEWMWGADITGETTTMFASFFSHVCAYDQGYGESTYAPKLMDARLYNQMSPTDARLAQFKNPAANIDDDSDVTEENAPSYCNFKFKKVIGWLADYIYMRASEMYLIEAEALAQQNKEVEAYAVLKLLMDKRDPQWSTIRTTASVEDAFLQKRLELWGEGHIFYDYLRLKKPIERSYSSPIASNHYVKKDVTVGAWDIIYKIPQGEIDNNAELSESDQNPD